MLDKAKPMNSEEAISAIKSNWPDARYTMLREALEIAITALEERDKLVKALEWYADNFNYADVIESDDPEIYQGRQVFADNGKRARTILSEIKGQGEDK